MMSVPIFGPAPAGLAATTGPLGGMRILDFSRQLPSPWATQLLGALGADVVKVERRYQHPIYKKFITRSKKFHAHDEKNVYKVGDSVRIQECRPMSKLKTWEVVEDAV